MRHYETDALSTALTRHLNLRYEKNNKDQAQTQTCLVTQGGPSSTLTVLFVSGSSEFPYFLVYHQDYGRLVVI